MKSQMIFFLILLFTLQIFADGVQPTGIGTESDPYQVEILDNLLWISTNDSSWAWDKYFTQIADIDASDTQNWNNGEGFSPIGSGAYNAFTGVYDGRFHEINGLYINRPNEGIIGLFGYVKWSTARIVNLGLIDVNITGGDYWIGGLVGYLTWSAEISNCYSSGMVIGNDQVVGGLVGQADGGAIIQNCYATTNVEGDHRVGGLIGFVGDTEPQYCYSTGNVIGNYQVGGIIGELYHASIYSCVWNTETSGQSNGIGSIISSTIEDLVGCSTSQMQEITTYTDIGWDFVDETTNGTEDIWDISSGINNGFPFLNILPIVNINDFEIANSSSNSFLKGNYPNPFNPTTTIKFSIQNDSKVELTIFNIKGQKIKTLISNEKSKGNHSINWNGEDDNGKFLGSGIYFYKLNINGKTDAVRKCLLLK